MHDEPHAFKPLDPGRVNDEDPLELEYWCKQFGCTRAQLEAAIAAVGLHVTEIRDELARRVRPKR